MAAAWDVFSQSKFRTDTPKKVTSIVNEAWNYVSKEAYKELKIFGDLMWVQFSVANSILKNWKYIFVNVIPIWPKLSSTIGTTIFIIFSYESWQHWSPSKATKVPTSDSKV